VAAIPEIELGDGTLRIGADVFTFAAVTSVAYMRLVTVGTATVTNLTRRFKLEQPGTKIEVNLDGAKVQAEERQELWERLVDIAQREIEPRLRAEAMELLRAGNAIEIERLQISRDGFRWRGRLGAKAFAWSEFHGTSLRRALIKIETRTPKGTSKTIGDLGTETPNAVLIPELMASCAREFGAGALVRGS
jgi:hypothetical protein